MAKTAKFYNAIIREVARRQGVKAKRWKEYLLSDGYLIGTEPMSEEEEQFYLARITPFLPEIAQKDPKKAAELMKRIQALTAVEV